jgi:NADH-quinone oxidoreductase subunit G
MTNFTINGQAVTAAKGETIINVARREGIYIPTMCYIEKTSPCASCRLCSVEVEGVDGLILSCNTPPTEGIVVHTNSERLDLERTNIMKLYDVNHPLECGVCDKSGACDLQNKTLEFNVDQQAFTTREQPRPIENWGLINYDPTLCIMCEKCTHVCNEVIGDDAIDVFFGGYSSVIVPKNSDKLDCTFCGECIAVCPVGALVSSDFQYTANAWELEKVPSTCAHCSAGCAIEYEVKHTSIDDIGEESIYRVTNDFEYATLCGAGRFGFDFENSVSGKDESAFTQAVTALNSATSIAFSSEISNEEAYLLQTLKENKGVKLINDDARLFGNFVNAMASTSGECLYTATLDDVIESDQVIVLGSRISTDNPQVRYSLTQASKRNKARITYMHPIEDALLQNTVTQFTKYEVGSEEGVIALLAQTLLANSDVSSEVKSFLSDLDEGYLSAESNIGEEEFAAIAKAKVKAKKTTLVLGQDLYAHAKASNIAKIAGLIEKYSDIKVLLVPATVNTLGVSLICDLDEGDSADFGYKAAADFIIGSDGANLDMPALNQQEGTVTSINKQVLPLNVALAFKGYTLLDLCKAVNIATKRYTVDYTAMLPSNRGFSGAIFDSLENRLDNFGKDVRGYKLNTVSVETVESLDKISELPTYDGTVIYHANPVLHFNSSTAKTSQLDENPVLKGSNQFATAAKISHGDAITLEFDGKKIERVFELDETLKGTIALHPTFDLGLDAMPTAYRFNKAKILKGEVNE